MTKNICKLDEYVAHSPGEVTSLCFGRQSGRVIATGGSDNKVNLWAVAKPNCIMSLTGHNSSVESVEFNNDELKVAAGSVSGSVRVWDLNEHNTSIRAFSGHKSSVNTLDFHPFGNFLATGSADCVIKLWNVNQQGCIHTYKGHKSPINMVRFSPDGKWLVSADNGGMIKIWDLSAGKELIDLGSTNYLTGGIFCVTFHPTVLLLACGGEDKCVHMFDLENLKLMDSSGPCVGPIRRIVFHPQGHCLYAANSETLKIFSVDPLESLETLNVGWNKSKCVADMVIAPSMNQLIGASISQSIVQPYLVDLRMFSPAVVSTPETRPPKSSSSTRKIFIKDSCEPTTIKQSKTPTRSAAKKPHHSSQDSFHDDTKMIIQDNEAYEDIFRSRPLIPRNHDLEKATEVIRSRPQTSIQLISNLESDSKPTSNNGVNCPKNQIFQIQPQPPPQQPQTPSLAPAPLQTQIQQPPQPQIQHLQQTPQHHQKVNQHIENHHLHHHQQITLNEPEIYNSIRESHNLILLLLTDRKRRLQDFALKWRHYGQKRAIDDMLINPEPGVLVDILTVLNQQTSLWTLDFSTQVIPHIPSLLSSEYQSHFETGCNSLKIILKNHSLLIKCTLSSGGIGVDLSREERKDKCKTCFDTLERILNLLENPKISEKFQTLVLEMKVLIHSVID